MKRTNVHLMPAAFGERERLLVEYGPLTASAFRYDSGVCALGLCLPATAEPEGYTAEKAKGHVRQLTGGAALRFEMMAGYLAPGEAARWIEKIGEMTTHGA